MPAAESPAVADLPALVTQATAETSRVLAPLADRDWEVRAGDLDWSCRTTAVHVADDLFSYASQVIAQPEGGYLPVEIAADDSATPRDLIRAVVMCGELLRLAAADADPGARGWHPSGSSDGPGFAAMGVCEVLAHTWDIAQGLGVTWTPPAALCAPVLERIFPDAPGGDPSAVFLWCTGRSALGDRDRQTSWSWDSRVRG